jgi:TRAP-type C4-dicarboxylate transport system permease small subunit
MVNLALKLMEQCIIGFSRIINYVATFLFGLMVLFVAADVVGRYFFSKPIKGDYEFVEVMTGMVISLSLSYTLVVDQHVRIKILTSRCSQKTQLISDILTYFSGLAVFTLASWQTIVYANSLRVSGLFIGVLPIPAYPFVYIVAISFIALGLVFLVKFVHSLAQVVGE